MGAASTWARAFRPTGRSLPQSTHHVRQSKIAIGLEHSPPDSAAPISAARSPALSSRRTSADGIGRTIEWVRDCVSEVVVIDCGSSHAAVEIAQRLGNAAASTVSNLDADEGGNARASGNRSLRCLPPASPRFRPTVCASSKYIPAALCRGPLSYVYRVVRLYDRRKARYATSLVHDRLITGGATSASCRALHFSVRSLKGREGVQGRRHASAARQFDGSELNWFKACAKLIMFYLATP